MQRRYKILFLVIIIIVDLTDLASDWLLYVDLELTEKGLVYGRPDQDTYLYAVSVIGSLCYISEIPYIGVRICEGKLIVNFEMIVAVVTWFKNVPQLGIGIMNILCREQEVFQICNAVVIVLSVIIRLNFFIYKCYKRELLTDAVGRCVQVIAIIGLLASLGGAISLFVYTIAQSNQWESTTFREPDTVLGNRLNGQRYFKNVSIFVSLPAFRTPETFRTGNWIRVASIDRVRNSDNDTLFKFEYQKNNKGLRFFIQKNDSMDTRCYTIGANSVSSGIHCNDADADADAERYLLRFTFIPPGSFFRKMIFGDIRFNVKHVSKDNCNSSNENINREHMSVNYFRSVQEDHLVLDPMGTRFYRNDDLKGIREVWKTGLSQCKPSGNMLPQLDSSIKVPCDIDK